MTPEDYARLLNDVSFAAAYLNAALSRHGPEAVAQAAEHILAEGGSAPNPAALTLICNAALALAMSERERRE